MNQLERMRRTLAIINVNLLGNFAPSKKEHKALMDRATALRKQIRLAELVQEKSQQATAS